MCVYLGWMLTVLLVVQAYFKRISLLSVQTLEKGTQNEKMFKSMLYGTLPYLHMPQFSTVQGVCKPPFYLSCCFMPSSMNEYNCTAIKYAQLLRITRHETSQKPSVAYQYTALLFQITICCLWRQKTPLIKAVFHPASYTCTVDCSLSSVLAKLKIRRLHMKITRS